MPFDSDSQRKAVMAQLNKHGIHSKSIYNGSVPSRGTSKANKMLLKNLGNGAVVEAKNRLGGTLNDIPPGSVGVVVSHFGSHDRPIVNFMNHRQIVVENPKHDLDILKGKNYFDYEYVKAPGSAAQLKKRLRESIFFEDAGGNSVIGNEYVDDGEGHSGYIPFEVEVFDNRVKIIMDKSDIPYRWKGMSGDIYGTIEDKVKAALETY